MKKINLGKGLELPLSVATMKQAYLGGNGSGKSYAASVMIEQILLNNGWVIILDYVGIHWGLRLQPDGKKPSKFQIPIFGGDYGDTILTPESGKLLADVLCEKRTSAILDISLFTDAEMNRFVTDFADRFFMNMKRNPKPVTLVFEEAQELIPEMPTRGEEKKLHHLNRIVALGRNKGIGVMIISPRPQEIKKKSLNLSQMMLAFQMTGKHERKAIQEWFSHNRLDADIDPMLPNLKIGEAFVSIPRLGIADVYKINKRITYDASATPELDMYENPPVSLGAIDMDWLTGEMQALVETEKANDPAVLKRKIKDLEFQLGKAQGKPVEVVKEIKVPVLEKADLDALKGLQDTLNGILAKILGLDTTKPVPTAIIPAKKPTIPASLPVSRSSNTPKSVEAVSEANSELGQGEKNILKCLLQFGGSRTIKQLRIHTGYKTNSIDTYLRRLQNKFGYVDKQGTLITATPAGWNAITDYEPAKTGTELRNYWSNELSGGPKEFFDAIVHAYPNYVDPLTVYTPSTYQPNSIETYIRFLMRLELIIKRDNVVRASEELFKETI